MSHQQTEKAGNKLKEVTDGIGIQEMPHGEEGLGRRMAPGTRRKQLQLDIG